MMGDDPHDKSAEGESIKRLLARLDGALDEDPNPLQPRRMQQSQSRHRPAAPSRAAGAELVKKPKLQLVSSPEYENLPRVAQPPTKWYHRNTGIAAVALLASVAICSPLVLLLWYQMSGHNPSRAAQESQSTRSNTPNDKTTNVAARLAAKKRRAMAILEGKDAEPQSSRPFLKKQPKLVRGALSDIPALMPARPGQLSATPAPSPDRSAPVAESSVFSPAKSKDVRMRKDANNSLQLAPPSSLSQRNTPPRKKTADLPRTVLAPELTGRAGTRIALSLRFEPFALLPHNSFIMLSGLPDSITLSGGVQRGPGIWMIDALDVVDSVLDLSQTQSGRFAITADLFGPDGSVISQAKSWLVVEPVKTGEPVRSQTPGDQVRAANAGTFFPAIKSVPTRKVVSIPITSSRASPPQSALSQEQDSPAVTEQNAAAEPAVTISQTAPNVERPEKPNTSPETELSTEPVAESDALPSATVESVTPPPVPLEEKAPAKLSRHEAASLIKRGRERIAIGDIALARLLFERAAVGGSGVAAFALAETFDPNHLRQIGAIGLVGDAQLARQWYLKARQLDNNTKIDQRLGALPTR